MFTTRRIAPLALLPLLAALAGCEGQDPEYTLQQYDSCDSLEKAIKEQASLEVKAAYAWRWSLPCIGCSVDFAMAGDVAMESGGRGGISIPANRKHSDTNVQEAGVDEADLVETDGTHLYALTGDHLMVNLAWPPEAAAELGRVAIEGAPHGIYLLEDENLVAAVSQLWWGQPSPLSGELARRVSADASVVKVTVVDVSDKTAPRVIRETYTQGTLYDSRVIGTRLYVASYTNITNPGLMAAADKYEALRAVRQSELEAWMPARFDNVRGASGWTSREEDVCGCGDVYGSERRSGTFLTTVESMDLADSDGEVTAAAVLGSLRQIYASASSLYLFSQEENEGPWLSGDRNIETIVHRFDISDATGAPTYVASGEVPGWMLNQFSADEENGRLRVATTEGSWGGTSAGVYVLERDGRTLDVVGSVEDLAWGETIFAVRFVADTAYVVTFEQIDPLFTIDLTDPTAPRVRGELEITGFSNYLHPMDETRLLGIGMEATPEGWVQDVQVSIFDVSNLDEPALESRLVLAGTSWSEAQQDHHAFNYYAPQNVLIVPMYESSAGESKMSVMHAAPGDNLSELGRLSQRETVVASGLDEWMTWCTDFRRSVVIEDTLYAVSGAGVTIAPVRDPENVTRSVAFSGIDPCVNGGFEEW